MFDIIFAIIEFIFGFSLGLIIGIFLIGVGMFVEGYLTCKVYSLEKEDTDAKKEA
jgi:uncharacterized protein YebE (UPF0316 family)